MSCCERYDTPSALDILERDQNDCGSNLFGMVTQTYPGY